jgi:hypothetical protein
MAKIQFNSGSAQDAVAQHRAKLVAFIRKHEARLYMAPVVFIWGPNEGKELRSGSVEHLTAYSRELHKAVRDGRSGRLRDTHFIWALTHERDVHSATCSAIGLGEDDWPEDGGPAWGALARFHGDL